MVKCTQGQVRRLKTALRWNGDPQRRQRIQMVLLRESGMTQPAIAEAMGVSLSKVNRAHTAYDGGGLQALKSKPSGGFEAGSRCGKACIAASKLSHPGWPIEAASRSWLQLHV